MSRSPVSLPVLALLCGLGLSGCLVTAPPGQTGADGADATDGSDDTDGDDASDTPDPSDTDGGGAMVDTAPDPVVDTDVPVDTGTPVDSDGDGLFDFQDNCVDIPNPGQDDLDGDDVGDPCDDDRDGDSVPNDADPWPADDDWPGVASPESIYAHTASSLYRFHVPTQTVVPITGFTFNQNPGQVTDLAIDQWGVLYAVTFDHAFICRPDTAQCRFVGSLPTTSNGLTFVPPGTLDPLDDVLVGTGGSSWFRLDASGAVLGSTPLGTYGGGATSSGDAFSITGVGTFASVNPSGEAHDEIVSVDPATGQITGSVVALNGGAGTYTSVWGLAGWTDGFIYAFDASGDVLKVDVSAGTYTVLTSTNQAWWGAGVRTVIPNP